VNTHDTSSGPADETPLVEPNNSHGPSGEPETLDTDRILRETGSITVPHDQPATPPAPQVNAETTASTESVVTHPEKTSWNIVAIASLVLGLALSPLALVFGYLALGQIKRSNQAGESAALAAIVLGWTWTIVFGVAGIVLGIIWFQL
jgi:hypothetical protein